MKSYSYNQIVCHTSSLLLSPPEKGQTFFHLYSLRLLFCGVVLLLGCQACYRPVDVARSFNGPSLRLNGYALVGQPINLGTDICNASGVTFNPQKQRLYVVLNGPEMILELALDGSLLRRITLDGFEDTEGIVWLEGDRFAVIEERRRRLVLLTLPAQATQIAYADSEHYLIDGDEAGNKGLEGLAWNAEQNRFYLAKEKGPRKLYQVPLPQGSDRIADVSIPWDVQRRSLGLSDISDLYHSQITDHLLLLSDESKTVVEVDGTGREVSRLVLEEGVNGLDHDVLQPEGLTCDDRGNLYVCSEPNQLYVFSPAQRHHVD